MRPVNIDLSSLFLNIIWSKNICFWSADYTIGIYKQWMTLAGRPHNRPIFSYTFYNILSLPGGFNVTLNAYGRTEGDMSTNRFGATWFSMDASVSRWFLYKSLQLKISVTDIFNTANNDWSMDTFGVNVSKRQSYDRRSLTLSVTYRLHPRSDRYKGRNASDAELRRL